MKIFLFVLISVLISSCQTGLTPVPEIVNPVPPVIYVAGDGSGNFNCDGKSDQIEINAALDFAAEHPEYTTVHLKGANTFWIDEPIYISADTTLEGDKNAVVKLIDHAKWRKKYKPLIGQKGTVFEVRMEDQSTVTGNITIRGFELNGNRNNQNEPSGHAYYRMIQLQNCFNITINDMYIHNGLADAILVEFGNDGKPFNINSDFYNNRIHNDGHDGIYIGNAVNFKIHDNIITNTRTDASIRVQNCNNFKIYNNIAGNAPDRRSSGAAAVHIMNYGSKPINEAEIFNNFFYGNQTWHGIWLEQLAKGGNGTLDTHRDVYIHNNVISQYRLAGIGIYGFNNTRIENNIIEISIEGSGITFYSGDPSDPALSGFRTYVRNNIIINNAAFGIDNKQPGIHSFVSDYNCLYGNISGIYNNTHSATDIYSDPLLACKYELHGRYYNTSSYNLFSSSWKDADDLEDSENPVCKSDLGAYKVWSMYHLKSETGRWNGTLWFNDSTTSPCIDAGDPASDYSKEPAPNGGRINIGAFGNTPTASKSN